PSPRRSTRFPYTTLFRSELDHEGTHPLGVDLANLHVPERPHEVVAHSPAVCEHGPLPAQFAALAGLGRDALQPPLGVLAEGHVPDRKSTRLNSSHVKISY